MAAVRDDILDPEPQPDLVMRRTRSRLRWGRGIVLLLTAVFFLVPLYAGLRFALQNNEGGFSLSAVESIPSQPGFVSALGLSTRLAVVTTLITLALMVPTAVYVRLRLPRLCRLFDGVTLLPLVIPPVVIILGVLRVAPTQLKGTPYLLALEYAVLAMPFAYRSLDAGLRATDLRTLVDAARSLGSNWASTLFRVLIPNLRAALLSAVVLTVALVLGEFTMASLDQYETLMVWVVDNRTSNAHVSVAISLFALFVTWLLLLAISMIGQRKWRKPRRTIEVE